MKYLILLAAVTALLCPAFCEAQSQSEISAWMIDYKKQTDQLSVAEENLRMMSQSPGISRDYYQGLTLTSKYLQIFNAFATGVLQVSYIYTSMIDSRDIANVKGHLTIACENLRENGRIARASINEILPLVTSGAVRDEIVKARDGLALVSINLFCK